MHFNFSGSSIPVGIAIGRQRQPGGLHPQPPWKPLPSPTGTGTSTIPPPLGSLGAPPGASSSGTPSLPVPATPNLHHQGLHPHNPWLHTSHHLQPSPAGPIPMGYQLAKDPLTGQILLIPTGILKKKVKKYYFFKNCQFHEKIILQINLIQWDISLLKRSLD